MAAQRSRRAIACDVATQLTSRRLNRYVGVARRRGKALRKDLEVEDESFHLRLHLFALRRDDPWRFRLDRTGFRNFVHRLLDDLQAFADLRDAQHIAAIAIGIGPRRYVKVK